MGTARKNDLNSPHAGSYIRLMRYFGEISCHMQESSLLSFWGQILL